MRSDAVIARNRLAGICHKRRTGIRSSGPKTVSTPLLGSVSQTSRKTAQLSITQFISGLEHQQGNSCKRCKCETNNEQARGGRHIRHSEESITESVDHVEKRIEP